MEKLIVKPNDVRCLGDIVSPKSLSDFEAGYNSLTKGSDTVDGASSVVYINKYMAQCHFEISSNSRFIPYTGQDSFEVTTGLYLISAWTHGSISDATVKCYLDDVLISTGTTDSNGQVSFTIPISERTVYPVKFVYDGGRISLVEESCGCSLNVNYVVAEASSLTLIGEENIIQSGDTDNLLATLTGTGVDGETIPIPWHTVSVYEEYTPALGISADKSIIQSGETANISLQLKDAEDGSLVHQSGVTIELYKEIDAIIPPLDGTDRVSYWTTMDNRTSNGIFRTHGGYLAEGWDNSRNWTLNFDYRYAKGTVFSVPRYVGIMPICSSGIRMYTDAKLVDYGIACWEGGFSFAGLGREGWISSPESTPSVVDTDWNHITITKLSSTRLKIVLNNVYTWIGEFPNLANLETLYIGSRDNPSDRDHGSYVEYKDIILEYR